MEREALIEREEVVERHERLVELLRRNEARDEAARKAREQRERGTPRT